MIKQEGVLSQQERQKKNDYLTYRICIFPGRVADLLFLYKSIKGKELKRFRLRYILWKQFRRFSPSFTVSKQYVDKAKAKLSKILLRNVFLK